MIYARVFFVVLQGNIAVTLVMWYSFPRVTSRHFDTEIFRRLTVVGGVGSGPASGGSGRAGFDCEKLMHVHPRKQDARDNRSNMNLRTY